MRASALWKKDYDQLGEYRVPAKQSQSSHCGLRISGTAPGNRRPPSAELSYCGLGDRPSASSLFRPTAPNKPDFGQSGQKPRGRLCKTKPISGGHPAMGAERWVAPGAAGRERAKQTQFLAGKTSHHSNIPPFPYSNPVPIVQNKANLANSQTRGKCGK